MAQKYVFLKKCLTLVRLENKLQWIDAIELFLTSRAGLVGGRRARRLLVLNALRLKTVEPFRQCYSLVVVDIAIFWHFLAAPTKFPVEYTNVVINDSYFIAKHTLLPSPVL